MTTIQEYAKKGIYIEIVVTFRYGRPMWSYRVYSSRGYKILDNYNDKDSYHEDYDVVLERAIKEVEECIKI